MATYKVVCPKCHKAFSLKTPNPASVLDKQFRCPKCGYSAPYSSLIGDAVAQDNPALHTHIAGGGSTQAAGNAFGGQKTKVAQQAQIGMSGKMSLVVESTGMSFPLMPGVYILGRASSDSKATLKLAPDPYMSRQHARLVVDVRLGKMQCQLCGLTSTNPIFINDKKIAEGSAVTLKSGDKILLGMTKILFKA